MAALVSGADSDQHNFSYRVTGKQSIERLVPLLSALVPTGRFVDAAALRAEAEAKAKATPLDLVWETTCEKDLKDHHQLATVLNRLSNSHIIESKSSFASLQQLIDYRMLTTWVAVSGQVVTAWAMKRWNKQADNGECAQHQSGVEDRDWWVVKASRGNGGRDIWVINEFNYSEVVAQLPANDEYVIQRYANNPLLFRGKKFHFRCYTTMTATGTAHLYQKAFILSAGLDFDYADADVRKHVTNLSVNKRFAGHPGQVPCHLPFEYAQVYAEIGKMWAAVVSAAWPYMRHQTSALHFEFFGIDVIADAHGQVWLIEANRLPGLESSSNNQAEEDCMYDEMMTALLRKVLRPIVPSMVSGDDGLWDTVRTGSEPVLLGNCWTNLLKWKAFSRSCREKVLAEFA